MRELGICFSAPLIPPIMADLKTVTRRIVTPQPEPDPNNPGYWIWRGGKALLRASYGADYVHTDECALRRAIEKCARYQVGDHLYIKEKWCVAEVEGQGIGNQFVVFDDEWKRPNGGSAEPAPAILRPCSGYKWGTHSGRFMAKKYARTWIEVLDLRAEQLHWITEDDAKREGVTPGETAEKEAEFCAHFGLVYLPYKTAFARTWDKLHGRDKHGWDTNPWVVRYEFRRLT